MTDDEDWIAETGMTHQEYERHMCGCSRCLNYPVSWRRFFCFELRDRDGDAWNGRGRQGEWSRDRETQEAMDAGTMGKRYVGGEYP